MSLRIDYTTVQSDIYQAMGGVGKELRRSGLEQDTIELVFVRASQINGCAYCLSLHIPDAREAGITQEQIDLLPAWHETGDLFTQRQQAALAWTDAVTNIGDAAHDDPAWEAVTAVFNDGEAMALTWAIAHINAWNRIAIPMRRPIKRATAAPEPVQVR